jgi:hypothetical protein
MCILQVSTKKLLPGCVKNIGVAQYGTTASQGKHNVKVSFCLYKTNTRDPLAEQKLHKLIFQTWNTFMVLAAVPFSNV